MPLRNKQYTLFISTYIDATIVIHITISGPRQFYSALSLQLIVYFYTFNYLQWSSEIIYKTLESYKAPYLNSYIDFRLRYDFT